MKGRESDLKVIIIGAGIGGAAVAVALQNEGIQAEVYERASSLKEVGAAIVVRPPSMHLLEKWGVTENELISTSFHCDFLETLTADGQSILKERFPCVTDNPDETWGKFIHRADLHNALLAQLPSESIHLNHKCETVVEHENYAEVHFADGSTVKADLVIAADGIRSVIRPLFSDDQPIYSGYHAYRGIVNREDTFNLIPDNTATIYQDGQVYVLLLPIRSGAQVSVDVLIPSQDSLGNSWSTIINKEDILENVKNFHPGIQKIIGNMEDTIDARALYDRNPIRNWNSKKIVLLGDAAHPMLPMQGQGGNMAIEDAGALVKALREADSISQALQQYTEKRQPITSKYQQLSRWFLSQKDEKDINAFAEVIKSDF